MSLKLGKRPINTQLFDSPSSFNYFNPIQRKTKVPFKTQPQKKFEIQNESPNNSGNSFERLKKMFPYVSNLVKTHLFHYLGFIGTFKPTRRPRE